MMNKPASEPDVEELRQQIADAVTDGDGGFEWYEKTILTLAARNEGLQREVSMPLSILQAENKRLVAELEAAKGYGSLNLDTLIKERNEFRADNKRLTEELEAGEVFMKAAKDAVDPCKSGHFDPFPTLPEKILEVRNIGVRWANKSNEFEGQVYELRKELAAFRKWAQHMPWCYHITKGAECDCGLAALLEKDND